MRVIYLCICIVFILASCSKEEKVDQEQYKAQYTDRFNQWLDAKFDSAVARDPVRQSYLGIKKDYDKWTPLTEEYYQETLELKIRNLKELALKFNYDSLTRQGQISYKLYKEGLEESIAYEAFHYHDYPVNQMFGWQSRIPSFLINIHTISDDKDALAYIERLEGVSTLISQLIEQLKIRKEKGIMAPSFVYPKAIEDCRNILDGAPFKRVERDAAIFKDFKDKVNELNLTPARKNVLIQKAERALINYFQPAYNALIIYLKALQMEATDQAGVWKLPNGEEYYQMKLKDITTIEISPDEVFKKGMEEVKRIHESMIKIKEETGFEGDLQDFFEFMRRDPQFYFSNTQEGRQNYLEKNKALINEMRAFIPNLFQTLPKAELKVKAVEEFREKSAGKAFYQRPALDGSRPGIYYVNLYDLSQMPVYQLPALAYHEAIPGHHMQISIAQELTGLPKFRTTGFHYTAYVEGWGLYAEYLPKEYGFYKNPYDDFGRLAMELWRACRLVVDVGIHHKKWSREEGIKFYNENTPNPYNDCVSMVERHIVMPGQATAYKIGQLKIIELRNMAKEQLGEKFDIKEFHNAVLKYGAVPLDVLEKNVGIYIKARLNNQ